MSQTDRRPPFVRASNTARGYFTTLFDFSFTRFITIQMFPVLYGVILISALIAAGYFTVEAFLSSWLRGLFYLLVAAPVGFITVATITRALMEFYLVVFRIYEDMEDIRVVAQGLSGISESMESMRGITRRLPFLNSGAGKTHRGGAGRGGKEPPDESGT
ncbi:MAG: DUF4282 domain-containing protein [Pseudomonadota bacterium]|nr:hypothetical protein [Pseudomonadales bacterium]MDY6920297.1 DUF4282 domain-containing protein [Pseudomonadota bacterium]